MVLERGSEFNNIPYPHLEHVRVRMGGNAVCVVSKQVNFHCMSHDILSMNRDVRKLYLRYTNVFTKTFRIALQAQQVKYYESIYVYAMFLKFTSRVW